MLTIVPEGGLCNRMRSIASAYALARKTNRKLRVIWLINNELGAAYEDLFLFNNAFEVKNLFRSNFNRPLTRFYFYKYRPITKWQRWLRNQSFDLILESTFLRTATHSDSQILETRIKSKNSILLYSCAKFYNPKELSFSIFQPLPELQDQINLVTSNFTKHTIGVHIRRKDHKKSINNSPVELFISAMEKEISLNPNTKFFLASDCHKTTLALKEHFSNYLYFRETKQLSRKTEYGIKDAVIDLWSLSKTNKILGSYGSSFSHTAAELTNIPEITIKK